MNLRFLSNRDLHLQTVGLVERERAITVEVLWHLREVERRMLYAEMSYKDLKEYCVKELKYSEGSAWRRIEAMRLLKDLPEVEKKLQEGELNLTQAVKVQSFFRQMKSSSEEKKEILEELEGQTVAMTDRILAEHGFDVEQPLVRERPLKGGRVEATLILDKELLAEMDEINLLLSKEHSILELVRMMTKSYLQELRKKSVRGVGRESRAVPEKTRKSGKSLSPNKIGASATSIKVEMKTKTSASNGKNGCGAPPQWSCGESENQDSSYDPEKTGDCTISDNADCNEPASRIAKPNGSTLKRSRYISRITFREVKAESQYRCRYFDPVTGRQCTARHGLQNEHKIPFADGGSNERENLERLCPAHNRLRAKQRFGHEYMKKYVRSMG